MRVSALCPGPTSTEFGAVAGYTGNTGADAIAAEPGPVVAAGIAGLEANKAIVIPGLINNMTAQSSRFLPRSWVRKAVGGLKK